MVQSRRASFLWQLSVIVAGIFALALWPPARGRLLMVPLAGASQGRLLAAAVSGGARLVGRGPAGTLVVDGERARIEAASEGLGLLLLAAPHGACGDRA